MSINNITIRAWWVNICSELDRVHGIWFIFHFLCVGWSTILCGQTLGQTSGEDKGFDLCLELVFIILDLIT